MFPQKKYDKKRNILKLVQYDEESGPRNHQNPTILHSKLLKLLNVKEKELGRLIKVVGTEYIDVKESYGPCDGGEQVWEIKIKNCREFKEKCDSKSQQLSLSILVPILCTVLGIALTRLFQ